MIALCATGVIWAFVNKFSTPAYADYLDIYENENAIVNFNQQINFNSMNSSNNSGGYSYNRTENNFVVSGTSTATQWINTNVVNFNITAGHTYYFYINSTTDKIWLSSVSGSTTIQNDYLSNIKSFNSNYSNCIIYIKCYSGTYTNEEIKFYCIDLTLMFGEGNEPNLAQAQELFKSNYYYYNTGIPMSIYGIDYYNAAYQDIMKSYKYNLDINALGINTFAYRLNNHTADFYYSNESGGYWGMINCIGIPLFTTLNSGAKFTISTMFVLPNVPDQYYSVCFAYLDDKNNMIELYRNVVTPNETAGYEFLLNTDIDTIYMYFRITDSAAIVYDTSFNIWNLNVSATQLDINSMVINANQSGQTIGYRAGYQAGYQAGLANTNGTLGTMEYVSAAFTGIGEILQIELLPNVPFSLFILLPLMFGLISFVIKLTKGGGGD